MDTTCQGCGHTWTADDLKRTGVHHFSAVSQRRTVAEPTGESWEIRFGPEGNIRVIEKCKQCPLIMLTVGGVAGG